MRIAIVTESFLPQLNGVTTSVCRILDELAVHGHEAIVIAPSPAPSSYRGFAVHGVPSLPVRQFKVGLPTGEIEGILAGFGADVVHVASPFVLGARGITAAQALGIPCVAIYQTDMAAYVQQHGGPAGEAAARATWRYLRWLHSMPDLNLAPSQSALDDLARAGIGRTALWGRGVDAELYHPSWRDDAGSRALRRQLAPRGETIIGYVGRLAPEKELHRLVPLLDMPDVVIAIVGDGPAKAELKTLLPSATFLGRREGDDLARAYAAADVFVHTGTHETFGQTIQEAAATGLPVIAPRAGGPIDLVDHGRTGLLFDPEATEGPESLAGCVASLTSDEDAWARRALMGEAARAHVEPRSWSSLVRTLIGHYSSVVRAAASA